MRKKGRESSGCWLRAVMTANGMPTPIILSVTADRSSWPLNPWCKKGKERKSQLNKMTSWLALVLSWQRSLGAGLFSTGDVSKWQRHIFLLRGDTIKFNILLFWIWPLVVALCAPTQKVKGHWFCNNSREHSGGSRGEGYRLIIYT